MKSKALSKYELWETNFADGSRSYTMFPTFHSEEDKKNLLGDEGEHFLIKEYYAASYEDAMDVYQNLMKFEKNWLKRFRFYWRGLWEYF